MQLMGIASAFRLRSASYGGQGASAILPATHCAAPTRERELTGNGTRGFFVLRRWPHILKRTSRSTYSCYALPRFCGAGEKSPPRKVEMETAQCFHWMRSTAHSPTVGSIKTKCSREA